MNTELLVEYNLVDTTALQDASESTQSNAAFGNLALIKDDVQAPNYGTLEHNFFVLDGSIKEFPDNPSDLVYFSAEQSDKNGLFKNEQSIMVQFSQNHTSAGLTLKFLEFYPWELEVFWYDLDGRAKTKRKFYPDSLEYFCEHQVENYGKLKIVFLKALPWHNVKLQYVKYGTSIIWDSDNIKSGKAINDTDPISDRIATDKLTFDFVDVNNSFNPGNPGGLHKTFQRRQKMIASENVFGQKVLIGTYFLESFSVSNNLCKMEAIDLKGMLGSADFTEGRIYDGDRAGGVIAEIMAAAGIEDYTVDEETAETPLYGTLGIQTCQKALREVLFACGSIVRTSRQTGLSIYKSDRAVKIKIRRGRKFETTLQADRYVSDVSVKYKIWRLEDKVTELARGAYEEGTHMIRFSAPAANLTVNVGRIRKQMPYYVILEVPAQTRAEIVVSGQKYAGEELAATSGVEKIKSGEVRNTKTFSGALLNFESAKHKADSILDYYQLQQVIKTKHIAGEEKDGDWVEIENQSKAHGNFVAEIESVTTNLTGGFISTTKCRGYYKLVSDYYMMGEIISGEDIGIL